MKSLEELIPVSYQREGVGKCDRCLKEHMLYKRYREHLCVSCIREVLEQDWEDFQSWGSLGRYM